MNFPDSIPSCTWPVGERVVVTRACGLPLRIVRRWTPLQIRVTSLQTRVDVVIDAAEPAPVDLAIVDLQGRVVTTIRCTSFERIAEHAWRGRLSLSNNDVGRGVYALCASSQQGTITATFCVPE